MAPNSLFAILLRNPWWYSFLLVAVICAISAALLPRDLVVFGVIGAFPFVVTGGVALKRQWNTPSAAAVEAEMARIAALSWRDFSLELEAKFVKQGYEVTCLPAKGTSTSGTMSAADFRLEKAGQVTLVAAKRYKAATHGVEALEALVAQKEAMDADHAFYVCLGSLSLQAAKFAKDHVVKVGL
ncbi:MAG: restriction endonuclease [Betaproteobacteria bacterium]|nr:restriction endonuclease [Betaproteobacteria bacterium]